MREASTPLETPGAAPSALKVTPEGKRLPAVSAEVKAIASPDRAMPKRVLTSGWER